MERASRISNVEFRSKLQHLQKSTLVVQLILMAIGGCIFGIGVEVRPILRLVEHSYKSHVRIFCELMLVNGIVQIISAGFSCFTACWKLVWTMYIAVVLSICVILLQIAAIVGVFYLMSESTDMVTEFIHKAWFEWECQAFGSCHNAFINYIYYYMMPQVIISAIAIFFEIYGIITLWKYISTMAKKQGKNNTLLRFTSTLF